MKMTSRILFATLFAFLLVPLTGFAVEDGYTSLFNGNDLTGWSKKGGDATYSVDDGCIVGKRGPGPNTFLCSDKEYENFVIKFQFKFDEDVNSGMQFRSHARKDGDREVVFGYQCELAPDGMTGGIYDESRRNRWVDPLNEDVRELTKTAYKAGEWNDMTIQCVGPSIKTWLNGKLISDVIDTLENRGFFGLQVHSAPSGTVRWRNLRIKELPATPWVPLMGDKELSSLEVKPAGKWEMDENGVVHATSQKSEKNDGLVLTKKDYNNFAAKISFKQILGNSGLYVWATENGKSYWVKGLQGEIDGLATGGLWEVDGRGWICPPKNDLIEKNFKAGDWNDFSVVGIRDHVVTNLNGTEISNIKDPKVYKTGKLGLQLHGGSDMDYYFKDFYAMLIPDDLVVLVESTDEP
ncbi:MAG: 3-keto-disaccharide hydrolase [Thermoguttaceae bacterium]